MRHFSRSVTFSLSLIFLLLITSLACVPATIFNSTPSLIKWSIIPLAMQEDTIYTEEQREWSFEVPSDRVILLSLEAHIAWEELAGSANILELTVNDTPVTAELLINKPIMHTFADGRSYNYYLSLEPGSPSYWVLFYSPDYESNNIQGSDYQVMEGQAYLYLFDITKLVQSGQMNKITVNNRGEQVQSILNKPIPLTLRQVKLLTGFRE